MGCKYTRIHERDDRMPEALPGAAILEMGGQFTLLIERALRELGYRSVILDPKKAKSWFEANPIDAVILSGGSASVYEEGAPQPPENLLSMRNSVGRPLSILGICYGMQWLAHRLGGTVEPVSGNREYGPAQITLSHNQTGLFDGTPDTQQVWMSHGDSVTRLPAGFTVLATTATGTIAAMNNGTVYGVQFHPEVHDTPKGKQIIGNFMEAAGCAKDWKPGQMVSQIQERVLSQVGNSLVIGGFSGGVDSTCMAKLLAEVLGDRYQAITVDCGNFREGEIEEIVRHAEAAGVNHRIIDAKAEFAELMAGTIDAEEKRDRFRTGYLRNFKMGASDFKAPWVAQGTLAPDRIESGATGGSVIKTHHNVGLDFGELQQLHPLDSLFKYEVRALAQEIGLPESVWSRQPFPGPGLFIRVVGTPATPEKVEIVRWADARVKEILVAAGVYDQLSQLVVAYLGLNTVGVKGDGRVYGGMIAVRAVQTLDFMTARGVHFSDQVEDQICSVLCQHREVVRAVFDPTPKPPGTTEFE